MFYWCRLPECKTCECGCPYRRLASFRFIFFKSELISRFSFVVFSDMILQLFVPTRAPPDCATAAVIRTSKSETHALGRKFRHHARWPSLLSASNSSWLSSPPPSHPPAAKDTISIQIWSGIKRKVRAVHTGGQTGHLWSQLRHPESLGAQRSPLTTRGRMSSSKAHSTS
eukprot:SAG11_NODE_4206_length_2014_cov_1.335770_1_plen_170_part_00